jgi:CheY-like chemotaxis protein
MINYFDYEYAAPNSRDKPFPPQDFILGTYPLALENRNLGDLDILFPMAFIEDDAEPSPAIEPSLEVKQPADMVAPPVTSSSDQDQAGQATDGPPVVLILADQECNIEEFSLALQMNQCTFKRLGLQEDIKEYLQQHGGLKCVILIMDDVSDRELAAAIQIRSAAKESLPIIAAGSHWTKSKVLQAIKFGVKDILATPLSTDEIRQKISSYLV